MPKNSESHIVRRYDEELLALRTRVQRVGARVYERLSQTLHALETEDGALVNRLLLQGSHEVQRMMADADTFLFRLLARRCPVASDLRRVLAASKILNALERIDDETYRLTQQLMGQFSAHGVAAVRSGMVREVRIMGKMALGLLRQALDVYDTLNEELAHRLRQDSREMDLEFQSALRKLLTYVLEDTHNIRRTIHAVLVLKALERIGDHARSIADFVLFQAQGEVASNACEEDESGTEAVLSSPPESTGQVCSSTATTQTSSLKA